MEKGYRIALIVLTLLTLLSLALNGALVFGLLWARQIALSTMADARAIVAGVGDETFSYTFEVRQEIPVATSVPFHEEITVPVQTTIPIDTTVVVPINLGFTTYSLEVPIRTIVPVDLAFTVPISQTVDIRTTVPLELDVPIEIPLADTPLVGYLEKIDATLARLGEKLAHPLSSSEE
jgi:hypothetical protein